MIPRLLAPIVLVAACIFIPMQACAGNSEAERRVAHKSTRKAGRKKAAKPKTTPDSVVSSVLSGIIDSADSVNELSSLVRVVADSVPDADRKSRYLHLSEEDFRIVAKELGVEVAVIKAVVEIEAGKSMKGFWAPGVPVVNFDPSMCARFKKKEKARPDKSAKVPPGLSGYALKEWTQLVNACHKDARSARLGTFWGMFQIGGFNYKQCGCESIDEFVRLMSFSELEQLELFAAFVKNTGMLKYLKAKDWAGFSLKYNGPSYKKRGYHTRMAAAYARYSKK